MPISGNGLNGPVVMWGEVGRNQKTVHPNKRLMYFFLFCSVGLFCVVGPNLCYLLSTVLASVRLLGWAMLGWAKRIWFASEQIWIPWRGKKNSMNCDFVTNQLLDFYPTKLPLIQSNCPWRQDMKLVSNRYKISSGGLRAVVLLLLGNGLCSRCDGCLFPHGEPSPFSLTGRALKFF